MLKKLSQFNIGETGQITNVGGEGRIRRRLFDMGITPGADVYLRKKAPLGDPIEITIRGYELTLRKEEAELVILEWKGKVSR
ncbi:MAG: ferrous iron transport protein A [Erysipelotrichaceae bacterium]|nr:ferrous iron transport protein A [Erysipelotrichaceae bacterium]